MRFAEGDWFIESDIEGFSTALRIDKLLHADRSDHQEMLVFENERMGRVLTIDGYIQVAEADEFIYHEMLTHVPMLAHGAVKRALVIGGGDGGILRELFRYPDLDAATLVELDRSVVDQSLKWMPFVSGGAFDDPRLELIFADGAAFVQVTDQRYDVVIVDSTDPVGPGEVLFTEAFYRDCRRVLRPGGVLATQNSLPFLQGPEAAAALSRLKTVFSIAKAYHVTVPTYFGGPMTLTLSSDATAPFEASEASLSQRMAAAGLSLKCYTPGLHRAAFELPGYIQTAA